MNEKARLGAAEFIGTAILVIGGPGSAVIAGDQIGTLGVALAFGLSLLCAAYFIGSISGCHINPAVTFGLWVVGKTKSGDVPWYLGGQVLGGIFGAAVIFVIAEGLPRFVGAEASGFASNGWGDHSPSALTLRGGRVVDGYGFGAMVVTEIVLTALFVLVVVSTSRRSMPVGFTGLAVGFMLTLVHLVSIPVDNTSVNPARSLATAIFQGHWALEQVWAFILFPLVGGIVGGAIWKVLVPADDA